MMKSKRLTTAALALVWTLTLTACTVGPDYQRPEITLPAAFKHLDGWVLVQSQVQPVEAITDERWWTRYQDPALAALIEQIDAANQTLAQAEARYRQAAALLAGSQSQRFPNAGAQTGATRSGTASAVSERYNVSLNLSWLPDLWGRVRREVEASTADLAASAADLAGVRLAAQTALALAYFRVRVIDQQQDLLAATRAAYERTLTLTRNQYEAGIAARADVVLAETQLAQVRVQQQDLTWQRAQQEHAIAVLVGQTPAALSLAANASECSFNFIAQPLTFLLRRTVAQDLRASSD